MHTDSSSERRAVSTMHVAWLSTNLIESPGSVAMSERQVQGSQQRRADGKTDI